LAATFVVAMLATSACSSDDGGSAPSPKGSDTFLMSLLEQIPASLRPPPGQLQMMAGDLDRATSLSGVSRPTSLSDTDGVQHWMYALAGGVPKEPTPTVIPFPTQLYSRDVAEIGDIHDELGWTLLDVHRFTTLSVLPESLTVIAADVSAGDLTKATGDPVDGVWRLGGEDGSVSVSDITPARPLGESLRMGLHDGVLGVSRVTPPVATFVQGEAATLADDGSLAAVARALDAQGVYAAWIIDGQPYQGRDAPPPSQIGPFDVVGAGLSVVDGQAVATLAYHFPTDADAAANVAIVRGIIEQQSSPLGNKRYTEIFTLSDVRADGTLVIVTLALIGRPVVVWNLVTAADPLFSHV
jgi:hypothetical protein